MTLLAKNLLFTFVLPGTVAGWGPWWIAAHRGPASGWTWFAAWPVLALGIAI